jgi:ABC-type branched-subunit amino acid transport system substrate-binding protein
MFHPQRIEVASRVTKTLPPEAVVPGSSGAPIPGSGAKTVFVPGRAGAQGGKANYASAAGVTTSTINLGIIVPLDGPAAQLGRPLYRATQAYVNALNARGGIHCRLVQLFLQTACINCEDENLLAAKALVEQKHVFAVVNTYMNTYAFGAAIN